MDGRRVDRRELARQLQLRLGRRLLKERDAEARAGRRHRPLNMTEMRALNAAQGEEIGRSR